MTASRHHDPSRDLVCVAVIRGAHGVRGDVKVKSFTDRAEDCFSYGPLMSERGDMMLEAATCRPAKDHFVVTPKPIGTGAARTREDWEALKGCQLFVPRAVLPPPEEDEFYHDDLVGLDVCHVDGRALGRVKSVQNFGAQDNLEIVAPDGRTVYLIPFTKDQVPTVDLPERRVTADPLEAYLPDGL